MKDTDNTTLSLMSGPLMKYTTSCNTWHRQDQKVAKYCNCPHIRPVYLMCIVRVSNNVMDRFNSLICHLICCVDHVAGSLSPQHGAS